MTGSAINTKARIASAAKILLKVEERVVACIVLPFANKITFTRTFLIFDKAGEEDRLPSRNGFDRVEFILFHPPSVLSRTGSKQKT
jgi:hypothetical protein